MTDTAEVTIEELPITLQLPAIKAGSDYEFSIQMLDDNDDPQVTTSWTMEIKGRSLDINGDVLFDLTIGNGITHTAAQGRFDVKISHTITATITVPYVAWDCKVTDASGDITFPFEGLFKIVQSVTR